MDTEMFEKSLDMITWTRIMQVCILCLTFIACTIAYEMRHEIRHMFFPHSIANVGILQLSNESIKEINKIVRDDDLVINARVVGVDINQNTRHVIYSYSKDSEQELDRLYSASVLGKLYPLFNNDVQNNTRLVNQIRGEFTCFPYITSVVSKNAPTTINFVDTICAAGIPPTGGALSGLVTISTKRKPTEEEAIRLKKLVGRLAASIYERDVR